MKFQELIQQLPTKQRSIYDLVRFVQTRTDDNANYNLLLGAGCSVNSGIRSASELTSIWRAEVLDSFAEGRTIKSQSVDEQRQYLKAKHSDWYDPSREYSSLFERRYDLQRQRRMFVESEVSKKIPSIGYAYLTALVADGYFRTVFTTNFDDILNEAFYSFSHERPIVCAHDSSISSITVTSKRPKIIKLHGDYLFDDLKATLRETESLEVNMKSKLAEFAKEAGFIVVGYSGSDRSIMDILTTLLNNQEYLKGGIYWCMRSDSDVPEDLRRLFWRDRAYYVQIDGFDELFAEIFGALHPDELLPRALTTTARPSRVAERLLDSNYAIPETTDRLKRAKNRLLSLTKRSAIAGLIVQSESDERPAIRGGSDNLTDDELLVLTEATNLISDGRYQAAVDKLASALRSECRPMYKRRLLREQVQAFRLMGDDSAALSVLDQLIAMHPLKGSNHLLRANIESHEDRKLAAINQAIQAEPHLSAAVLEKGAWYARAARRCVGEDRIKFINLACDQYRACIELNPSISNRAWRLLYESTGDLEKYNKSNRTTKQLGILSEMSKQNPESYAVLSKKLSLAGELEDQTTIKEVLASLTVVENRHGLDSVTWVAGLRFAAHTELRSTSAILQLIEECQRNDLLQQDTDLAYRAAVAVRKVVGDESLAERILTGSLKQWDFDADVFESLFDLYIDLRRTADAEALLHQWGHFVVDRLRTDLLVDLLLCKAEYSKALSAVQLWERKSGTTKRHELVFINLCAKNYSDAERTAREALTIANFSPELVSETVNYELARKLQGKKPDQSRLEAVLRYDSEPATKAAAYSILGRRADMLKSIRDAYSDDKRFKYSFSRWPVFSECWQDKEVLAIFQ